GPIAGPSHRRLAVLEPDLPVRRVVATGKKGDGAVEVRQRQRPYAGGERARVREILDDHATDERPVGAAEVDDGLDGGPHRPRRHPREDARARGVRGEIGVGTLVVDKPYVVAVRREARA